MNRGVEIDSAVADDIEVSLIQEQVEMGVAIRMAVLDALARGPGARGAQRAMTQAHRLPQRAPDRSGIGPRRARRVAGRERPDRRCRPAPVQRCRSVRSRSGRLQGPGARAGPDRHARLHRRARQRASRDPGIGEPRGGRGRRHDHRRHAQHRSDHRRAVAGRLHPAPRRRDRAGPRRCRWRR